MKQRSTKYRSRVIAPLIAALATLIVCPGAMATGENGWQSLDSIRAAAVKHIEVAAAPGSSRVVATADAIDTRLRLAQCARPLTADLPYPNARGQRVTVEVRCESEQPWKILVPVRLQTYGSVVVAAHTIPRNSILSAGDLTTAELDLGRLHRGHIREIAHLVGKKVRRGIAAGEPIAPNMVLTPPLIRRGQAVTLKAGASGMSVSMKATALSDGGLDQVIDVSNESSGRIVQGIVRSARVVEVLLY